ncbi:MAG: DUF5597 domain-containing protein, partial [Ginsengibacter sp.]
EVGNLFWAIGHHAALGWAIFGIDDLNEKSQVAKAYDALDGMLPQLAGWQAAGKVDGVLLVDGEENQVITMGGYIIKITKPRQRGPAREPTNVKAPLGLGGVTFNSRAMPDDIRPFGMVINTAPGEFLFIGSNFTPSFTADPETSGKVAIGWIDEGKYINGKWVPGRRLNGDEGRPSLGSGNIGMLKIKLFKY